jgi:GTP-binding protein
MPPLEGLSAPSVSSLPSVVIVGRPNVGKSALFNRLAGRRLAIVHAEEGITRDRIETPVVWNGRRLLLTDTGGLATFQGEKPPAPLVREIQRQVDQALSGAAVILFVTDVETGPAPLDEEVADRIRRSGRTVFLVCNKCDHLGRDAEAVPFERFGFPVFPVSALHNRGCEVLKEAVLAALPKAHTPAPAAAEEPLRIAVAGRPNVGKSSLVNAWLGEARMIVSPEPGTTRDSVEIPFSLEGRSCVLVDTAGMRRKGKADTAVERFSLLRAERSIAAADVVVLVLDALQGPTEQDKKIGALIRRYERGCVLAVNKWDLVQGRVSQRAYEEGIRREAPFLSYAPVVFTSALTGYHRSALTAAVLTTADHLGLSLPTGPLNRVLQEAQERTPAPRRGGRPLRLYYATQVGSRPIRLLLFVNDPETMTPAYQQYLEHAVRAAFPLEGAPLVWILKPRRSPSGSNSRR